MSILSSISNNNQYNSLRPKILIFGVGGAGSNAIENMIKSDLEGVEFIVANTDAQALSTSSADIKIQLGLHTTKGLGAGSFPEIGKASAEEAEEEIARFLDGANMIFITAGMGGGTGTGAAEIIAKMAKERDILTAAVVTKPFEFEGRHRARVAMEGIDRLKEYVDTLIIVPNQNLFRVADFKTTVEEAFKVADDVLHAGVRGITDLITMPGLINLDFADVKTIMKKMGKAMMGTGEATGENRAILAVEEAISNPLLDNISISGAKGVIVNITGSPDITLFEFEEAVKRIKEEIDPNANIITGTAFNKNMEGKIRVSVFATGIDENEDNFEDEINVDHLNSDHNIENKIASDKEELEKNLMDESYFDPGSPVEFEEKIQIVPTYENKSKEVEVAKKKGIFGIFGNNKKLRNNEEERIAPKSTIVRRDKHITIQSSSYSNIKLEEDINIPPYLRDKGDD